MLRPSLALCVGLLVAHSGAATQDPTPQQPTKPEIAWPKTDKAAVTAFRRQINLLKPDAEAEDRAAAEAKLVEQGAVTAPLIIRQLGNKKSPDEVLLRVLDRVVEPEHSPLVLKWLRDRRPIVKQTALRLLAKLHQPEAEDALRLALTSKDPKERFYGALGLAGLGDFEPFDPVFEMAKQNWGEQRELIAAALSDARGVRGFSAVLDRLPESGKDTDRIAGLRLMRSLAPKDYAATVASFLDADEHQVRKAAINTLRVIVDGDPTIERMTAFGAIDRAKAWKAKIK